MREAVGHDAAHGLLLQAVISDGRGGLERLLKVARLENPALFHKVPPDAREAVGLKLHLDLERICFLLRHALLERLNLLGNAEHGLHMVPDFVGEDVSERKVAAPAELLLHVVIETQVKVDLPVGGTIEGAHRRPAVAAGGRGAARVEHELRVRIPLARGAEDLGPDVLRRLERNAGELRELLLDGRALVGRRSRRLRLDGEGLSRQQGTQNGIFTPDDHANPSITIKTPKKLTITGPWAIHAEGEGTITIDAGDLVLRGSNGIAANSTGAVSIDAQTVDIASTNKYGVSSTNTGGVTIKAEKSIYIKGGSANAVNGLQGAITLDSKGTTVVDGDILAEAATVSADFKGAGSSLTGAVTTGDTGKTTLGFSDGALWKAEGDSKVSYLTLKGGVVDLNNLDVTAVTLADNSAATIRLDAGAEKLGSFTVENKDVTADLNVDLVQNADVVDEALARKALAQIKTGDKTTVEAHVKEGLVNPDITFNKDGSTASVGTNTLIRDTLDLAAASSLSLNRILMNDVRKRMGDLRSSSGKNGVWARYDGGRLESDAGLKNDFNTFQAGFDTMPLDNGVRFGVAASYTWSDTDFARGEADMDAFGLAAYGVWMGDNGMFADVVARVAKASNDMTIDSVYKGDLDTVTTSLSGEFGWRFDLARTVWIEPQIEATYTHAGAEDLTLSNGVNAATYEIGDFDSLIGRAGFATGFTCPNNRGEVWLRASAVHEFLGDREIFARTGDNTNSLKQDGKDTWFEYGIGANFNLSESTYLWADVERTSGGIIDQEWRATIGVRYGF